MTTNLPQMIKSFCNNQDGQFATWFAIMAMPILGFIAFAVDSTYIERTRRDLASALDDAALAAILNQTIETDERKALAEEYFNFNIKNNKDYKLEVVESGADRVELKAEGVIKSTLSGILGRDDLYFKETAISETINTSHICIMALSQSGDRAFEVANGSTLSAKSCGVQVNSSSPRAAFIDHTSRAATQSYCVKGEVRGNFSPPAMTQCAPMEDPYKYVRAPATSPCPKLSPHIIRSRRIVARDGLVLSPGRYCGGLFVLGKNITFLPGTYIMQDGPLEFAPGSSVRADDVNFVMRGDRAYLDISNGSTLSVKAASSGPLAGIAFFQDQHYNAGGKRPRFEVRNTLRGGAGMSISGAIYFPTQDVVIGGGSGITTSPSVTSIIGSRVRIERSAYVVMNTDYRSAGLPNIFPNNDVGARLVE